MIEPGLIMSPLMGLRVVANEFACLERVQFSRSPARAKRRAARGYKQHFVNRPKKEFLIDRKHGVIYCHPSMVDEIRRLAAGPKEGA